MKNYKIAAALIGSFVLGAGAASVFAQGTAPYYEVAEINVKDVDVYKKAMSKSLPMIKEHGGTYVAGGFEKAKIARRLAGIELLRRHSVSKQRGRRQAL